MTKSENCYPQADLIMFLIAKTWGPDQRICLEEMLDLWDVAKEQQKYHDEEGHEKYNDN